MHLIYKKFVKNTFRYLLYICAFTSANNAYALIIIQQASVSTNVEFDNNPNLQPRDAVSMWRYSLNPQYTFSAADDKNRFFSNAGLNILRSSNQDIIADREDPNLNFGWDRELERGRFSIVASYNRTSSRFREFRNTGFVDNDNTSVSKSLSAVWNYAFTERLDYSLSGNLTKNINTGDTILVGNSTRKSINSTLTYAFNEIFSPFLQASYTTFKPEGINAFESNSRNYIGGFRYLINDYFSASASAGITDVSTAGTGKLFNANLDYQNERSQARLSVGRNTSPSDIGQFLESDSLSLTYNYLLSDKSSIGADYFLSDNRAIGGGNSIQSFNVDNKSSRIGLYYIREFTPTLQMRLSINSQQIKSINQDATGEIVGLFFTYNTPEF